MLNKLRAFRKWYTTITVGICATICFVILGMNVVQLVMRYVIDKAFTYTEDITILGMLWMMSLGISIGCLNHEHLLINIIDNIIRPENRTKLIFAEDILMIGVGVAMVILGNLSLQMNKGFTQSMIGFDESFRYLPVVVGGVLTSLVSIENVWEQILVWKEAKKKA